MNYIEAHNICSKYVDAIANNSGIYYPISLLRSCGASNKKVVEDAMILFLAHAILWNDLSQQEMENIQVLLLQLDNFVDDELLGNIQSTYKLYRRRINLHYTKHFTRVQLMLPCSLLPKTRKCVCMIVPV